MKLDRGGGGIASWILELLILYYVNFTSTTKKMNFSSLSNIFNIVVASITCTHHYSVEEEVNG